MTVERGDGGRIVAHELTTANAITTARVSLQRFNFALPPDALRMRRNGNDLIQAGKMLIITTGDASDADGFISVAMYARTGADLMFIMNLPAMYSPEMNERLTRNTANAKNANATANFKYPPHAKSGIDFLTVLKNEQGLGFNYRQPIEHSAESLCQLCYTIVKCIWDENTTGGNLYFIQSKGSDGGGYIYNKINPFGSILNSEFEVYKDVEYTNVSYVKTDVGEIAINAYEEIYMDGNGSFAFYDAKSNPETNLKGWFDTLKSASKLKAISLMAGVEMSKDLPNPVTLGPMPGMINRLAEATMNQVYSPQGFKDFIEDFKDANGVNWYITTNNEVNRTANYHIKDNPRFPAGDAKNALDTLVSELGSLVSDENSMLRKVVNSYYALGSDKRKLFDVMSSLTLTKLIYGQTLPSASVTARMYTEPKYGVTLVDSERSTGFPPESISTFADMPEFQKGKASNIGIKHGGVTLDNVTSVKFGSVADFLTALQSTSDHKMSGGGILRKRRARHGARPKAARSRSRSRAPKGSSAPKAPPAPHKWVSTGRQVSLSDGRARVVFRNSKTGELRVRRKSVSRTTGKVSYAFVTAASLDAAAAAKKKKAAAAKRTRTRGGGSLTF